ncbi:hypothetical protein F3K34_44380 [Streptomyces sp. LBUM 1486]|uniref:hypothetical protein n=1 Tax=Streptomyces scabiei TaxID=1930 RepID=UPI001B3228F2|nr:hypothetical protein [Streptomyces sp. LBUM 1486]MBP5918818.1 hypothetical protein [Streptomyces sp. LBUM 1486]
MISHQPTPEHLERLEQARLAASQTDAAVADARAKLAHALAEHSEASATLSQAINTVLYGPPDDSPKRLQNAYEASNDLAREHWPTRPPGTPGG